MPTELLLPLVTLAFAAAWTPGPNNAMVASSGATFGLRRTVPHVLGIALGFPMMVLVVGLALGEMFQASAAFREILRWSGAVLLLWVAWRVGTASGTGSARAKIRPMTFVEAAAFQWINPKGWAMAIAATAQFVRPDRPLLTAGIVAGIFLCAGFTSAFGWASAGQAMRHWLAKGRRLRVFNVVMGASIAAGVVLFFRH